MSLRKKSPKNSGQPIFLSKHRTFTMKESSPKILATSVFFKNLLQVYNRPLGEKLPNLVTLVKTN
jgi:hypothetical protein